MLRSKPAIMKLLAVRWRWSSLAVFGSFTFCLLLFVIRTKVYFAEPADTKMLMSPSVDNVHARVVQLAGNKFPNWKGLPSLMWQPLYNIDHFFEYVSQNLNICNNHTLVGGIMKDSIFVDGEKWVCLDKGFGSGLHNGLSEAGCVVLAFGINNDWSFEESMADKLGCQVYAFDPTMGLSSHRHSDFVEFFDIGLSNVTGEIQIPKIGNSQLFKVDRYENIVKKLKLEETQIFYLKIDIDGFELEFFDDVFRTSPRLLSNVRQIGMEIHPRRYKEASGNLPGGRFAEYWKNFQFLEILGFKLAHSEENNSPNQHYFWNQKRRSSCYELVWINTID